ncbi:MAG: rRNA maturation RNase YbeY [Pseudomonadota bacterium]
MSDTLIHIDMASDVQSYIPSSEHITKWSLAALMTDEPVEINIRIMHSDEMRQLNATFRQQNKPTNVLSFPAQLPEHVELNLMLLGDIAICADIIAQEANEQHKDPDAHWAHIVIHGCLHLQGYDHIDEDDAIKMEILENRIITSLHFSPPYDELKQVT